MEAEQKRLALEEETKRATLKKKIETVRLEPTLAPVDQRSIPVDLSLIYRCDMPCSLKMYAN